MIKKEKEKAVSLHLLSPLFYSEYNINKFNQILNKGDSRGYGIFLISLHIGFIQNEIIVFSSEEMSVYTSTETNDIFQQYDFAIPLHSNIKKGFILKTHNENGTVRHSGLDYNKAVIIKPHHIDRKYNLTDRQEFNKINTRKRIICQEFTKFLKGYISAIRNNDQNILTREYLYTTLQYFHSELYITELVNPN